MTPDPRLFHMCFEPTDDEDEAAAKFEAKYGFPPDHVFDSKGLLYVGPTPPRVIVFADTGEGWGE